MLRPVTDVIPHTFPTISRVSTGGTRRVPRGRSEDTVLRDDERHSLSNHVTPRVKPTRTVNHHRLVRRITVRVQPTRRIEDLNPTLTEEDSVEMWPLSTAVTDGATGVSTGRGEATDSHGRCGAFGCDFQPTPLRGRSGGLKFACGCGAGPKR
ncbi:MAG: hypothetical protein A07HR60_00741 [uncultured archaeon A07HR60]|nr:MAG: hypothetical protein A07HR60_00741 [uncultured archaeon A07HR60]